MASLASRFKEFRTDENSVHNGAVLKDGGIAVDANGILYKQVIEDRLWWAWDWKPFGRITLPKALRNAFRDLDAAKAGVANAEREWRSASERYAAASRRSDEHRAALRARREPASSAEWLRYDDETAPLGAAKNAAFRRWQNLLALQEGLQGKVDRLARPLLLEEGA